MPQYGAAAVAAVAVTAPRETVVIATARSVMVEVRRSRMGFLLVLEAVCTTSMTYGGLTRRRAPALTGPSVKWTTRRRGRPATVADGRVAGRGRGDRLARPARGRTAR